MDSLRIRLEGQVEVICGRDRRLVPLSVQPLTVALVASGRKGIDRGQLLRLLWPDEPVHRCRRRLNTAVWRLRDLVTPNAGSIMSSSTWLGLDATRVEADVDDLLAAAAVRPAVRRALPMSRMLRAAQTEVGQFARGCTHSYVDGIRDNLRRAHVDVCAEIAARAFDDDEYEVSVLWARRVLAEDPYREELHRLAIRALHRLGRSSEAERQFAECRRLLRHDLGVDPHPETVSAASHVRPVRVRSDAPGDLGKLYRALEDAIRSCEQAARAGRALLESVDGWRGGDPAVIPRDRPEIGPR